MPLKAKSLELIWAKNVAALICRNQSVSPRLAHEFRYHIGAGWSSPVAREAHNLEVVGSNPAPATSLFGWETDRSRLFEEAGVLQQRKTPAFFVFSCNLLGLNHSPETRFSSATLAKTAPLWGPIRDKYSQSLWVMKTAGLTTLGYESSA